MSDATVPGGDDQNAASGDSDKAQHVSLETHRKLLGEKKRREEELAETRSRLQQLEQERKAKEENELRQKEDWKKMLEMREQELAQVRAEQAQTASQIHQFVKKQAFSKAMGGNFNPAYERLIDFDQIPFDPTSGNVDELALTKYVDTFKKTYKEVVTPVAGARPAMDAPKPAGQMQESREELMQRFAKGFI